MNEVNSTHRQDLKANDTPCPWWSEPFPEIYRLSVTPKLGREKIIPLGVNLEPEAIPTHWDNVAVDLGHPPDPPLGPDGQPVWPGQMGAIFPLPILEQEMSAERWIAIPEAVHQVYALWRPSPL
jgi:hypothetical protein